MPNGDDERRPAETRSFKELLREPPCIDDFPDTSDLRRELPREIDLESDPPQPRSSRTRNSVLGGSRCGG